MQTWAKRGVQTALVTGGLLMLGTGIASANEKVDPDTPAGPLDVNLSVPYQIKDNAIGTPGGQVDMPDHEGEISTKPVTDAANAAAEPVIEHVNEASGDAPLHGNKVVGNVAVPVQATGNAAGIGGDAEVDSSNSQSYEHNTDVSTDGANSGAAGNAVVADWAAPVQLSGNAGGLFGSGKTTGSADQSAATTGDIATDGSNSGLSGNVASPQFATPVQLSGNALGWFLGNADAAFDASSEAESGGSIQTEGSEAAGSGNVGAGPLALPLRATGNAVSWGGNAEANSSSEANATAGGTATGMNDIPSYVQTGGDDAFLGGNIVQPQGAGVGSLTGNAAAWIGNSVSGNALSKGAQAGTSTSSTQAGGFSSTSAENGGGSGNIVDAPVALPVEGFGVGGTWIGNAHAAHDSATDATSGDGTYTNGEGAVLGGNSAHLQPAGALEAFGIGGSWIGNASGVAEEEKHVQSGGYNGTVGDGSSGSGNIVQVPVAVPGEIFGVGGSWIGQGTGEAEETKEIIAGGDGNTDDDLGFGSSNLVAAPLSVPAQAFGIGGAWIGQGHGQATADTTSQAGGDYNATGVEGSAAGNIVQAPLSLPAQLHGIGGAWIGNGTGQSDNLTDSIAGGNATADGTDGSLAGNVVQAPMGAAATAFGLGGVWGGVTGGEGTNDVVSEAGGDVQTAGDGGSVAGNVVGVQGTPVAQAFGDAASLLGVTQGHGTNTTDVTSGGDIETSGVEGALSGDILDVPAAAVVQVFGNAASLGGVADAFGDNVTSTSAGGSNSTEGSKESLSGINGQLPLGALVQIYGISADLLANATAEASNMTSVDVAGQEPQINLPIAGDAMMGATELPNLAPLSQLPTSGLPTERQLPGGDLPVELPVDGLPVGELPVGQLPVKDLPIGDLPADQLPVKGLPIGDLPVKGLPVGLPVHNLPADLSADLPVDLPVDQPLQRSSAIDTPELPELPGLPELTGKFDGLLPGELPGAGAPRSDLDLPVEADVPALENLTEDNPLADWFFGMTQSA